MLAAVLAPRIVRGAPPGWLAILLPVLVATDLAALALADVRPRSAVRLAGACFAFAVLGASISLLGVISSLPTWSYKFLLAAGVGACTDSTLMAALSRAKSFRERQQEGRARTISELEGRGPPD